MVKGRVHTRRIGLLLALFAGVFAGASEARADYSILDLGVSNRDAEAGALNNNGHSVFYSDPDSYPWTPTTIKGDAYLFNGTASTVQTGIGAAINAISDINNHDHAVGWSDDAGGYLFAVEYENGIALPLVPNALAFAINDADQVTGWLFHPGTQTAFLYDSNTGVIDLGTLGGRISTGYGINNHGVVVGSADTGATQEQAAAGAPSYEAFQYRNGVMTGLGTLGGSGSGASAINELDEIVGEAMTSAGERHAFLFDSPHGMQDLGIAGLESSAMDINNQGEVVGQTERVSGSAEIHAFLYDPINGMQLLEDLIPANSGWQRLLTATSINDRGQILGDGFIDGRRHVFLMTPTPEPSSLILFFFAVTSLMTLSHRRNP
jgi:probable HAF family extracellular repeat protein